MHGWFYFCPNSELQFFLQLTLTMAMGYITAWTPFAALSIFETFYPPTEIPSAFRYTASLFCKSATAFNPFIYFFMRQDFIEVMYRMCFGSESDFESFRSSVVRYFLHAYRIHCIYKRNAISLCFYI